MVLFNFSWRIYTMPYDAYVWGCERAFAWHAALGLMEEAPAARKAIVAGTVLCYGVKGADFTGNILSRYTI